MLYIILVVLLAVFAMFLFIFNYINTRKNIIYENSIEQSIKDIQLNLDELQVHARQLGQKHKVSKNIRTKVNLLKKISSLKKVLINTYRHINKDVKNEKYIVPAAEWFLDNFYVIEEQVNHIEQSLSQHYYKELPKLVSGPFRGYPRVYAIATEIVSHTDGHIDDDILSCFINSYQQENVLISSEIWAFAIMIRIALVQNIKVISDRIAKMQDQKRIADELIDTILNNAGDDEHKLKISIEQHVRDIKKLDSAFVERLLQHLRDEGSEAAPILEWLYDKLTDQGISAEYIIKSEHKKQTEDQISIGNSITSLRFLDSIDWHKYFEKFSTVEKILCKDPDGIYSNMDFESRNYYRSNLEKISKKAGVSEIQLARKAIECAASAHEHQDIENGRGHVGYYIIGDGREILESAIGYLPIWPVRVWRSFSKHMDIIYVLSILLLTSFITFIMADYAYKNNVGNNILVVIAAIVCLIPASDIGVKLINWLVTSICQPCFLPKLELKDGIPEELATMVVIPTLLSDRNRTLELMGQMETYYLSNREDNLFFAILGDYLDAPCKDMAADQKIIDTAMSQIKRLNDKYAKDDKDIFYLFHRERLWNDSENIWMGWERKRGKLIEFNRLMRGDNTTTYTIKSGDIEKLPKIKYIITLDSDTQLPGETAKILIGTCAHILNRPVLNDESTRVIDGYGILQPRISISITNAYSTNFSKIYSEQAGVDPYTTAVSDVYQDLFCEGIFTGKGIYDIDVFQTVLDGKLPENAILSHDLLEGSYARTALVSDIELVDGYPSKYNSYSMRLHRWVRGDWQVLPWLSRWVRDEKGKKIRNPINTISKWKITDNLRRSLLSPTLALLIILGIVLLPGSPYVWVIFALVTVAMPIFSGMLNAMKVKENRMGFFELVSEVFSDIKNVLIQVILSIIFLPYQSYLMVDAIIRTIGRLYFTKKNMLEWQTAADAERKLKNDLPSFIYKMWPAQIINAIFLVLAYFSGGHKFQVALPISVLWAVSPYIAYWISQPLKEQEVRQLNKEEVELVRRLSRKTWRYFEDFVGEQDNWLPPDNYQEYPNVGVAHRTSPTNIGLWLTSILSARDMGYINTTKMVELLENTFNTLGKLKRWRGHFYNWYDTVSIEPMRPFYISTVDSGNLVGYLIVLKNALKEYMDKPLLDDSLIKGIQDAEMILAHQSDDQSFDHTISWDFLKREGKSIGDWYQYLEDLDHHYRTIDVQGNSQIWKDKILESIDAIKQEIDLFFNWINEIEQLPMELIEAKAILEDLSKQTSLNIISEDLECAIQKIEEYEEQKKDLVPFKDGLKLSLGRAKRIRQHMNAIIGKIEAIVESTDFRSLYNGERQLFSIGYNLENEQLTDSYYDLLASEARQASYIAIAKGDISLKHWFRLNRPITKSGKHKALVSWSGTMFEYLMPLLVMKNYKYTLLDETYNSTVFFQKKYSSARKVPWGISESAFYAFDMYMNYQYRAFGIPKLGFKHGLIDDLVITPYATVLALMVNAPMACENLKLLIEQGMEGEYGLYEAIDYTKERIRKGRDKEIVKSYMVHHHGMIFLALNNYFNSNTTQNRFHSEPMIKAQELLLQEKIPDIDTFTKQYQEDSIDIEKIHQEDVWVNRRFKTPYTIFPEAHILSNGKYMTMITNSGAGFSAYQDTAVSRWREDSTRDNWGSFIYIQNLNSNSVWSATVQPFGYKPERYRVNFYSDKVEFFRKDGNIDTKTEIIVCPQSNVEIRRVTLTNHSEYSRVFDVTSYFEVVLSTFDADNAHPAFNKLFVKTEYMQEGEILLANRRPKSDAEESVWLAHTLVLDGSGIGDVSYETDREKFIGRGRTLENPISMEPERPLSNTAGVVVDPVMSMRQRLKIESGGTAKISFITAVEEKKGKVIETIRNYKNPAAVQRSFEMAWTRSQIEMHYLGISSNQASSYQRLGARIMYMTPEIRARAEYIKKNIKAQPALWAYGISGDLPIMVIRVSSTEDITMVKKFLLAHEYLRMKGLKYDLVILNEHGSSYEQPVQERLMDILNTSHARELLDKDGGVFLRQIEHIEKEDLNLLLSIARVVYSADAATLTQHLKSKMLDKKLPEKLKPKKEKRAYNVTVIDRPKLVYYNGLGGFSEDGKEYVIILEKDKNTPSPWSNVISNPSFGCVVTESGLGYTWADNSRQNRITPWNNDPVSDQAGEVVYIRDEDTGQVWTVTPLPIRDKEQYTIRHGQGYTVYKHTCYGISHEKTVFVAENDPVKICSIKMSNISGETRSISLTYYAELVMGVNRSDNPQFITTEFDNDYKVLMVTNRYNEDFKDKISFLNVQHGGEISYTGDRSEFIGRNRNIRNPSAMSRIRLSGRCGPGYDPCAALQTKVDLKPGEVKEVIFLLGEAKDKEQIRRLVKHYNASNSAEELSKIRQKWSDYLSKVHINTPDESMNILINNWLLYQVISCRLWTRSAFYQSGGAYGFRDQLQDVMSLIYASPDAIREHILMCAAHQFIEGDVQHWWHSEQNKGVRTKISDDLLWLPFVVVDYIDTSGDYSILDEQAPYLECEPLEPEQSEIYTIPFISEQKGSIYQHCIKAIERSLEVGPHGLPLIGSGDWNDGMNNVGVNGLGESVWLGWFLYITLRDFSRLCVKKGDVERAQRYQDIAQKLIQNIEEKAWDGGWYRRAYFDDGTPLGSEENSECKIDGIVQSWAVMSDAAKPSRTREAMRAVEHYLIKKENGMILLFTPPFDTSPLEPGYIKGYVPGVRENGGQYTHGAVWTVLAYAHLGDGDKAGELYNMLNPINHSRTIIEHSRYKVEPYVMAADVYATEQQQGRGGWTWYTGSASWMYRAGVEWIAGLKKRGNAMIIDPCIPKHWKEYDIKYRYKNSVYNIHVTNDQGVCRGIKEMYIDGQPQPDNTINLYDDGKEHHVKVIMGDDGNRE
ncbi:MAG: glucoamylase family protein [Clostridia bacterium]|nr:glucoamylase family protein [Clostridia bacterium]